jgi:predicted PurR-regulated permease PerM
MAEQSPPSGTTTSTPVRLLGYLVAFASIFVILWGIRTTAIIINPILLAAVITVTVLPVPAILTRRGLPGWLALVLTILLVGAMLALVIATVILSITTLATELPTYIESASQQAAEDVASFSTELSGYLSQIGPRLGPVAQSLLAGVASMVAQLVLALLIFFFMIAAAISLPSATRLGINPDTPAISRIGGLTEGVRRYMSILTLINFLVGLGDTIFLLIVGVDYAILWGVLAWFMGYIPSIGFWVALIPPTLLAYAEFGWQTALVVFIGYVLINGGVQNFLQPKMMGDRLRISPVIVFISLFAWGFLLGGIGAILAVPLTLLMLEIMENFDTTRMVAILMRYTGEEKKEERQAATEQLKGLWDRARSTFTRS